MMTLKSEEIPTTSTTKAAATAPATKTATALAVAVNAPLVLDVLGWRVKF